jgi:hypothetical protein
LLAAIVVVETSQAKERERGICEKNSGRNII